jgi:hypothetical protein
MNLGMAIAPLRLKKGEILCIEGLIFSDHEEHRTTNNTGAVLLRNVRKIKGS